MTVREDIVRTHLEGCPSNVPRPIPIPASSGVITPVETVLCWKWTSRTGYRSSFGPQTVNVLRRMVLRNYPHPHRFCCITDDPRGLDIDVTVIPDTHDFAALPSPHGGPNPSCYRRLRAFAPDAGKVFGPRFVSLDLDCVITGDLSPLWNRPEEFVIWGDTNPRTAYNGSMFLLTAGARAQVWTSFDPRTSPRMAMQAGNFGSDQAWISYCLGRGEATWTRRDGVYSYRNEIATRGNALPANARVVFCHGKLDPWGRELQKLAWVREAYC